VEVDTIGICTIASIDFPAFSHGQWAAQLHFLFLRDMLVSLSVPNYVFVNLFKYVVYI
jgi:hypothetical protein